MTEILICGQCNALIEDAYQNHSTWAQCFDCYCEEQEYFYSTDDNCEVGED